MLAFIPLLSFGIGAVSPAADGLPLANGWIVTNAVGTYHKPSYLLTEYDLTPAVTTNVPNSSMYHNVAAKLMARTHERVLMCATANATYGGKIMADYEFRANKSLPDDAGTEAIKRAWPSAKPLFTSHYYRGRVYHRGASMTSDEWITIFASDDKMRIVVVHDDGPIQFSESSGTSWQQITDSGDYEFTITRSVKGSALVAVVSLSNQVQKVVTDLSDDAKSTKAPTAESWYSVATTASGGQIVLEGGSDQTAPALSIVRSSNTVTVSWSASFTGFALQQTGDLNSKNWVNITNRSEVIDGQNTVTLPIIQERGFFRVVRP